MRGQRHAPAALCPGKDPVPIVQEAGWAPGPVWTGAENFAHTGIRSPDRPGRSQSLYSNYTTWPTSDKSGINIKMATQHWWNDNDRGETHVLGEKPVPVLLCPPKIPHELDGDRIWGGGMMIARGTQMHNHHVRKMWNV